MDKRSHEFTRDSRAFFEDLASRWDAQQPENREAVLHNLLRPFAEQLHAARAILEVGTGTGQLILCLRAYAPTARLISINLAHAMLSQAQQRAQLCAPGAWSLQMDVRTIVRSSVTRRSLPPP